MGWRVLGSTLLSAILAFGTLATRELKNAELIESYHAWIAIVVLVVLFVIQKAYTEWPAPDSHGQVTDRRIVLEGALGTFVETYEENRRTLTDQAKPKVRANIMLPTVRAKGLLGSSLRIYYCQGTYVEQERLHGWRKKEGTCGWAWKYAETTIFDSKDPRFTAPARRLRGAAPVIRSVKSVLSVPIWRDQKVIGVLNLDSVQNISQTCFNQRKVVYLAVAAAQALAPHLPKYGVSRR